jgi:hypothetical protein
VLSRLARSRLAATLVLAALTLNTVLFYLPAEIQRRTDFSALPGGRKLALPFVETGMFGPRLIDVPSQSLVVTDDWWVYNTALAPLNCVQLPDCSVLFALAVTPADLISLRAQFPGRQLVRTVDDGGRIEMLQVP